MNTKKEINERAMLGIGSTLQMGKYRVEAHLSSGGFGNTYMVTNTQFEERRAMKEFFIKGINERDDNNSTVSVSNKDNRQQFETQREKFKKEARRLRKLAHPNIVGVDDLFDENGTTYYVMDYIEGGSLSEHVKQSGAFSEAQVVALLPPLLDALEYVHGQQMWHLDLKPGNILIGDDRQPVLIDFGASKQMGLSGGNSTSTGMTFTPGYAPSEQVDQNFDRIGPWTDLYALGGTLYNLLTAEAPPSVSEIQEGEAEAFEFPAKVSPRMRDLIVWLMNPNRRKRPQSVAEVRTFLKDYQAADKADKAGKAEGDETVLGDKKPQPAPKPWWRRLSAGAWAALCAVAIAAAIIAFLIGKPKQDDVPPQPDTPTETPTEAPTEVEGKSYTSTVLGEYSYTGPVDDKQLPDGTGKAVLRNGRVYNGPFVHGAFHGTGATFHFPNGDVFTGEFRGDLFYQGRYTVGEDGSYFEGKFVDGQPDENNGAWYDKNNRKIE